MCRTCKPSICDEHGLQCSYRLRHSPASKISYTASCMSLCIAAAKTYKLIGGTCGRIDMKTISLWSLLILDAIIMIRSLFKHHLLLSGAEGEHKQVADHHALQVVTLALDSGSGVKMLNRFMCILQGHQQRSGSLLHTMFCKLHWACLGLAVIDNSIHSFYDNPPGC